MVEMVVEVVEMMVEDFPTYFPSCNFLFLSFFWLFFSLFSSYFFYIFLEEWYKNKEEFLGFMKRVCTKWRVVWRDLYIWGK